VPTPEVNLYRVFPWVDSARRAEPGHPLYVVPTQGAGRVDNPEHYVVLYASDEPAGAVAEAFGNLSTWSPVLFEGPPSVPGSVRAIARYTLGANVLDLDDPRHLVARKLRPSRVITRRRDVTQTWALSVFGEQRWAGVRWWGFHNPDWGSYGIWDTKHLQLQEVEALHPEHPAVDGAARALARRLETGRRSRGRI
jgi:hypothetical protein